MQVHTKNECSVSEYSEGIEQEDAMQQNVAKVCVCACVQQGSALSKSSFFLCCSCSELDILLAMYCTLCIYRTDAVYITSKTIVLIV
jgi:hypothetical protein